MEHVSCAGCKHDLGGDVCRYGWELECADDDYQLWDPDDPIPGKLSADYVPGRAAVVCEKSAWQSPVARPVLQIRDGKVVQRYESLMDAERSTGIRSGNICCAARGKTKTAGGYEWKYE